MFVKPLAHYNPYRGSLGSKEYPDNTGPSYTYYPSGRLHERTWARNSLKTTYAYNAAGQLTSIDYSDSTPDVNYTYDRRGRQLTASQGGSTATRAYSKLRCHVSTDHISHGQTGRGKAVSETGRDPCALSNACSTGPRAYSSLGQTTLAANWSWRLS